MKNTWAEVSPKKIPSSTKVDKSFWGYFKKGDFILDAGCGNGRFLFECAKRGFKATGIDINKKAIKLLNKDKNLKKIGVKAFYKNILSANFKNKFNGVLLQAVLCSLKNKDRIRCLKKAYSLLKNNGYLHVAEFEMSQKFEKRYKKDFKLTNEYGTLAIRDKKTNKPLCWSHNFYKKELADLIEKAGFKIISFKKTFFTSYHGEKKPGMMMVAKK